MNINKERIKKLAKIAKLDISRENKSTESLEKDLEAISAWVNKINSIDTKDISPLLTMSKEKNNFRLDDEFSKPLKKEKILKNAPEKDYNYFIVESFIENDS